MTKIDFGWHMPSFPVDGSSAQAFNTQIDATMEIVKDSMSSVWFDDHFWPWAKWQDPDTPYIEIVSTMAYYAGLYPKQKFVR